MYVCVHQVLEVFVSESDVRFGGVLEVKTLDYSNFVCQESFKSELDLEVFGEFVCTRGRRLLVKTRCFMVKTGMYKVVTRCC